MNLTLPPEVEATAPNAAPDYDDGDDFKDVYWPDFDVEPGETPIAFRLRYAFTCAGYRVARIEEVKMPPVLVVRAVRRDARRMTDHRLFFGHVRELLRQAGFRLRRDELTVHQTGDRILVAFQSAKWAPNFEEILREPQEVLFDYADIPL